jgi:hypothetical protein
MLNMPLQVGVCNRIMKAYIANNYPLSNHKAMINKLLTTAALVAFTSGAAYSQDILDVEKYKDAELFTVKKGYDVQQRLQEIEAIKGKEVTVYEVSGKQNKIKITYTGIADAAKVGTDKGRATLITVVTKDANGRMGAYFPLTNRSDYRIYLTEKMK